MHVPRNNQTYKHVRKKNKLDNGVDGIPHKFPLFHYRSGDLLTPSEGNMGQNEK